MGKRFGKEDIFSNRSAAYLSCYEQFHQHASQFIVIFAVVIISGSKITYAALYLPVVMIIEYIFALGVAYISSAITVYFRDMEQILGIAGMAWMYLTPVMYSVDMIPEEFTGY